MVSWKRSEEEKMTLTNVTLSSSSNGTMAGIRWLISIVVECRRFDDYLWISDNGKRMLMQLKMFFNRCSTLQRHKRSTLLLEEKYSSTSQFMLFCRYICRLLTLCCRLWSRPPSWWSSSFLVLVEMFATCPHDSGKYCYDNYWACSERKSSVVWCLGKIVHVFRVLLLLLPVGVVRRVRHGTGSIQMRSSW